MCFPSLLLFFFFFFNDTATTEIYTLSLHDALPILPLLKDDGLVPAASEAAGRRGAGPIGQRDSVLVDRWEDRKSTRLNSSHDQISYAVFCLKKKKKKKCKNDQSVMYRESFSRTQVL